MENAFLERYFGSNQEIVSFAKILILEGDRTAVKYLNELVDVLGDDDPKKLIQAVAGHRERLAQKFRNEKYMKEAAAWRESQEASKKKRAEDNEKVERDLLNRLRADVVRNPLDWRLTFRLAELYGYKIDAKRYLFKKSSYKITGSIDQSTKRNIGVQRTLIEVDSSEALSRWIADNLT